MRRHLTALATAVIAGLLGSSAFGYGEEGHSIVAEIAQRRLNGPATAQVERLLGKNVSLASVASWADDYRSEHRETSNWHFVDIPLARSDYEPARDCKLVPAYGDCILQEIERVDATLRCSSSDADRRMALKFAVHFLGDLHQPLHTVLEQRGGNLVPVRGSIKGNTCTKKCELDPEVDNLHALWDTTLIRRTVYDWGAYVDRLENGVLRTNSFDEHYAGDTPLDWALQTHFVSTLVWNQKLVAADGTLDEHYYRTVLPILDQELALGGLRLARFLNAALAPNACEAAPDSSLPLEGAVADLEAYLAPGTGGEASRYEQDQARVGDAAAAWVLRRAGELGDPNYVRDHGNTKMALVLDIDETTLDMPEWEKSARATAIAATLKLFDAARAAGVDVFFITGRDDVMEERDATEKDLDTQGFKDRRKLIMRAPGVARSAAAVADYKAAARASLVVEGYTVIANVGDQPGDLSGGFAEKVFLMPDPFHRVR